MTLWRGHGCLRSSGESVSFQTLLVIFLAVRAAAQSPQEFDVASIKPNRTGGITSVNTGPGGRLTATNVSLKMLVQYAFGIKDIDSTKGGRLTVTNDNLKDLIRLAFGVKDYQISGALAWIDSGSTQNATTSPRRPPTR